MCKQEWEKVDRTATVLKSKESSTYWYTVNDRITPDQFLLV